MSDNLSARATLNGLRLAPRKVSLVAGLVRGRTVESHPRTHPEASSQTTTKATGERTGECYQ